MRLLLLISHLYKRRTRPASAATGYAIWLDLTAHNLWPLELLAWFALGLVAVAMLYWLRWLRRRIRNRTLPEKAKGKIDDTGK